MKDKKGGQIAAKKRHKEALSAAKDKRRKQPSLERAAPTLLERQRILIVCEGENTEPSYFRKFKLSNATIKPIGEGYNTISLVERALELAKHESYDQVWCVFDADPKPDNPTQAQNFNAAIQLAQRNKFGVAYSNQAFEYWLILHFEDHQGGPMNRKDYHIKLNGYLKEFGITYDGKTNKIICQEFFDLLWVVVTTKKGQPYTRTHYAIDRARRNYSRFDHSNPAQNESSTAVFLLVKELIKYM